MNKTADLAYWINEREAIRLRREAGTPAPWSNDPHMATVRYCNIRREDDKVTKWLAANWRPKYHEVWQILLARLINNVPTLREISVGHMVGMGELDKIRDILKYARENGPIFGNAYTVSTNGRSMDKVDYIIDYVVRPAQKQAFQAHAWWDGTLSRAAQILCELNGVSTFMAGQIIADLKNTQGHPLQQAPDWPTWVAPGPGSLRGLEAYFGAPVTPARFTQALRQCYAEVEPLLADYARDLHMQDFQNCLCEFSKYMRVKSGGHARNRYSAPTGQH